MKKKLCPLTPASGITNAKAAAHCSSPGRVTVVCFVPTGLFRVLRSKLAQALAVADDPEEKKLHCVVALQEIATSLDGFSTTVGYV